LPKGAKACPECGSDEHTGWSEAAATDGLDLPDNSFDYDDFVRREFHVKNPGPGRLYWVWWLAAVFALAAFILAWVKW